ncbi:unnamed protein product [Leuciscus chuanchicus]
MATRSGRFALRGTQQRHQAVHSDGADSRAPSLNVRTQTRKEDETFTSQDILRPRASTPPTSPPPPAGHFTGAGRSTWDPAVKNRIHTHHTAEKQKQGWEKEA